MSRRILVADDSSTIQKVIKIAFSRFPVEIAEAASYIEALAVVSRGPPDVMIMDASLPGASGPADFARLASQAQGAPVLLLVGTYEAVDEAQFRSQGFTHFLRKPFDSADLVQIVEQLVAGGLGDQRASQAAAKPEPRPPAPPATRTNGGDIIPQGASSRPAHTTVFQTGMNLNIPDMTGASRESAPPPPPSAPRRTQVDPPVPPAPPAPFHASDETSSRFALDADELDLPMSPPISVDHARKGRRAFAPAESPDGELDAPPSRAIDMQAISGLGMPPPPPGLTVPRADAHRHKASLHGLTDEYDDDALSPAAGPSASRLPFDVANLGGSSRPASAASHSEAQLMATLMQKLQAELPSLVREAVEAYCDQHFKSLAKEVITAELRRLADDKARHLVES